MTTANVAILRAFISDPRCDVFSDGTVKNIRGRRFKGILKKSGYHHVSYLNKKIIVARLICAKFNGFPLDETMQVNHIDGNPANNNSDNLEWVTSSGNQKHRYLVLGQHGVRGHTKLSSVDIKAIRELKALGATHRQLCDKFKVSKSTVSYIVNNRTWVFMES
jgi:hypothetical protein